MAASIENLLSGFNRLPGKNRLGLLAAGAALIALAAFSFMWGKTPENRVLFSNISDRDGGAIVAALGQMNVPYSFSEGGSAILVPADRVHDVRLKLASQGLPRGGSVGFELMDSQKFGVTQFQEQVNYQRSLEGELARSIQALSPVQSARVHLAMPKPTVFLREQQKPTASVVLALHPGRNLDGAQIAGIVHLVSSSVPELNPKNVSVLDQAGTLLSNRTSDNGLDATQLAYVHEVEAATMRRILDIVEPVLGKGNVRAQVNAEVDFSLVETSSESFRPNGDPANAALRTESVTETREGGAAAAQGVAGAASNQPGAAAASSANGAGNGRRERQATFEVDKTTQVVRAASGGVKRISAAVVLNHRKVTADGKVSYEPLKKEEVEQVQTLVRDAMGFDEKRGDRLTVANVPFNETLETAPELPLWQQPENIALAKDVGKGLAAAALILYILFGLLRPAVKQLSAPPPVPMEVADGAAAAALPGPQDYETQRTARLDTMKSLARQDPKLVANMVRDWSKS